MSANHAGLRLSIAAVVESDISEIAPDAERYRLESLLIHHGGRGMALTMDRLMDIESDAGRRAALNKIASELSK